MAVPRSPSCSSLSPLPSAIVGVKRSCVHLGLGLPREDGKRQKINNIRYDGGIDAKWAPEWAHRAEERRRIDRVLVRRTQKLRRERKSRHVMRHELKTAKLLLSSSRGAAEMTHQAILERLTAEKDEERRRSVEDVHNRAQRTLADREQQLRGLLDQKDAELASQRQARESQALVDQQQQHEAALLQRKQEIDQLRKKHQHDLGVMKKAAVNALAKEKKSGEAALAQKSAELSTAKEMFEEKIEERDNALAKQRKTWEQIVASKDETLTDAEQTIHQKSRAVVEIEEAGRVQRERYEQRIQQQEAGMEKLRAAGRKLEGEMSQRDELLREKDALLRGAEYSRLQLIDDMREPREDMVRLVMEMTKLKSQKEDIEKEKQECERKLEVAETTEVLLQERVAELTEQDVQADRLRKEWLLSQRLREHQLEESEKIRREHRQTIDAFASEVKQLRAHSDMLQKKMAELLPGQVDDDLAGALTRSAL